MFCTTSVIVFSPASAADEAKRLTPKSVAVRDLIMRRFSFTARGSDQWCEQVKCQRTDNEDCRENKARLDDTVRQRLGADFLIRAGDFPWTVQQPVTTAEAGHRGGNEVRLIGRKPRQVAD